MMEVDLAMGSNVYESFGQAPVNDRNGAKVTVPQLEADKMERALPLTETQREELLRLIKENYSIVNNKSTAPDITLEKKKVWEDIRSKFNALYPNQHPRSSKQLKRSYDHVKRKGKEGDREYNKKIKTTGGGPPPSPPKATEELSIAASMMEVDVYETFGQAPVNDRNGAEVTVPQLEDDPDDPVVQAAIPSNTQPSSPSVQHSPAASSSASASSTPICSATQQGGNVASIPSVAATKHKLIKKRKTAKDDAFLCRTRQEEYHKLRIAQMKEMHALEIEHKKIEIENAKKKNDLLWNMELKMDSMDLKIENVYVKLMSVLESAKKANADNLNVHNGT